MLINPNRFRIFQEGNSRDDRWLHNRAEWISVDIQFTNIKLRKLHGTIQHEFAVTKR